MTSTRTASRRRGKNLRALAEAGFDVTEGRNRKTNTVEVVGTRSQIGALKIDAEKVVDAKGRSTADRSRAANPRPNSKLAVDPTAGASDASYRVWRKYDAVATATTRSSTRSSTTACVAEHPNLVRKRVVGQTAEGRDIIALQVTKDPTGADIAGKPAVLYNAMQHAREWLAGETCKRTLSYFVDNYGKTTSAGLEVTPLVDKNELWFVCVNNPDGYEYTFTAGNRLWRKNLRDNDNNGTIEPGDGVDPNRNFSANWGRDDEGSSPDPASETYRGPSAASEPETKAMEALFAEIHPVFQKNDHTAAQLLLYPQGFQQDTPTADNEIFTALAGDPFRPGIEGFLPELSAGLYITNGDFTDWAYSTQKTLSYTPEGTAAEDPNVTGFEYPDSPLQVDQEFRRHLQFVLDLAKSAGDPDRAVLAPGQRRGPLRRRLLRRVLRRPAAGAGDRPAQARRRHDEVQRQRRPDHARADQGVHGRRALLQERRRLLPPRPRVRLGHQPGRLGRGLVHRRRRGVQALHLQGGHRVRQPGAAALRRGLVGRAAHPLRSRARSTWSTYKSLLTLARHRLRRL